MSSAIETMLSALSLDPTDGSHHEKILHHAETSSNPRARQCRIVALLNLERYSDVVGLLETEAPEGLELEFAYALYRTGRLDEAKKLLLGANVGSVGVGNPKMRGMTHLLAQIHYRAESFSSAAKTYTHLLLNSEGAEESAVAINIDAVLAQNALKTGDAVLSSHLVQSIRPAYISFESLFNQACRAIAKGELMQAAILLKKSKDACEAMDGLSDEEKKVEIYPILVQQLYVAILMRRFHEASAFSSQISCDEITEPVSHSIAATNKELAQLFSQPQSAPVNPYLLQRRLMEIPGLQEEDKPFNFQTNAEYFNSIALRLLTNRHEGLQKSTDAILSAHPDPSLDAKLNVAAVANAAARLHGQGLTGGKEIQALGRLVASAPLSRLVGYTFAYVQLLAQAGRLVQAATQMDTLAKQLLSAKSVAAMTVLSSPGFLGLWLALKGVKKSSVHNCLYLIRPVSRFLLDGACDENTTLHTSTNASAPSPAASAEQLCHIWDKTPTSLILLIGAFLLQSWNKDDIVLANRLFEALRSVLPQDRLSQVGLAASQAALISISTSVTAVNPDQNQALAPISSISDSSFKPLNSLLQTVDVDHLEQMGIPSSGSDASSGNTNPSDLANSFTKLSLADPFSSFLASSFSYSSSTPPSVAGSKRAHRTQKSAAAAAVPPSSASRPQKRIRLSRQPKGLVPGGPGPDPERWLPLRERSYFKPKGKKGKKRSGGAGGGLTQGGGVSVDEAAIAVSSNASALHSSTVVAGVPAASNKSSGGKKTKKGRR